MRLSTFCQFCRHANLALKKPHRNAKATNIAEDFMISILADLLCGALQQIYPWFPDAYMEVSPHNI